MLSVAHFSSATFWGELNSMFLFFNKIICVMSDSLHLGHWKWGEIHTKGWGQIHRISVWGIEALLWRTVSEPPGSTTALSYPTRHFCCFLCYPPVSYRPFTLSNRSIAGDNVERKTGKIYLCRLLKISHYSINGKIYTKPQPSQVISLPSLHCL